MATSQKFLILLIFKTTEINENDISFFIDVIEQLGTEKMNINILASSDQFTKDNIFDKLRFDQQHPHFFRNHLQKKIDYIAENFSDMKEKLINYIEGSEYDEFLQNVIELIFGHVKLQLESEDELLDIINHLYINNHQYSFLYKYVEFSNVDVSSINKFANIFDFNDLTNDVWLTLIKRLQQKIEGSHISTREYSLKGIKFAAKTNAFDGIFNYFKKQGNVSSELKITASSQTIGPTNNLLDFDNIGAFFQSEQKPNQWICFNFLNHKIIPSNYIMRTINSENNEHLKSWVLEGSNDNNIWITIDEHKNDSSLKGKSRVHLFSVSNNPNKQAFKYLRIRQTGPNWLNCNDTDYYLLIGCIEFYGNLI